MFIEKIKKNTEERMEQALQAFRSNLTKIRTGRISSTFLEHIYINYHDCSIPLNQIASFFISDNKTILVSPWEKDMVNPCEKAIRDSDLGLNPVIQDNTIRVTIPSLTEQRRKELTKIVKSECEEFKITVRNLRRESNLTLKKMFKNKEISEDDERRCQDQIQQITDRFITHIDKITSEKEKEIMTV